jgi:hypothetical protein
MRHLFGINQLPLVQRSSLCRAQCSTPMKRLSTGYRRQNEKIRTLEVMDFGTLSESRAPRDRAVDLRPRFLAV